MLAQAELKRAQEEKRSSKARFRYACYRQGGALFCAVILFGIGSLIWMGRSAHEPAVPISSSVQTTAAQESEPIALESIASQSSVAAVNETLASRADAARHEAQNEAQTAPAVSLSREEMQGLVQAAGRSLRGQ